MTTFASLLPLTVYRHTVSQSIWNMDKYQQIDTFGIIYHHHHHSIHVLRPTSGSKKKKKTTNQRWRKRDWLFHKWDWIGGKMMNGFVLLRIFLGIIYFFSFFVWQTFRIWQIRLVSIWPLMPKGLTNRQSILHWKRVPILFEIHVFEIEFVLQ